MNHTHGAQYSVTEQRHQAHGRRHSPGRWPNQPIPVGRCDRIEKHREASPHAQLRPSAHQGGGVTRARRPSCRLPSLPLPRSFPSHPSFPTAMQCCQPRLFRSAPPALSIYSTGNSLLTPYVSFISRISLVRFSLPRSAGFTTCKLAAIWQDI